MKGKNQGKKQEEISKFRGLRNWQGWVAALGGLIIILSFIIQFRELYFSVIGASISIIFGLWSAYPTCFKKTSEKYNNWKEKRRIRKEQKRAEKERLRAEKEKLKQQELKRKEKEKREAEKERLRAEKEKIQKQRLIQKQEKETTIEKQAKPKKKSKRRTHQQVMQDKYGPPA